MERPVLLVDTREKKPFDFEGDDSFLEIKHTKLEVGDYTLEGLENIIVIERKNSADELFMNFTANRERIKAEFERMSSVKIKILLIEESCEDIFNPYHYYVNKKPNKKNIKMPVAVVAQNLTDLMLLHNVHILFVGGRGKAMLKGLLLKAFELHRKGKI